MYASGPTTVAAIATTLRVSRASVYRHLSGVDGSTRPPPSGGGAHHVHRGPAQAGVP